MAQMGLFLFFTILISFKTGGRPAAALLIGSHRRSPPGVAASMTDCDIFTGSWVRDDTYPLYQHTSCPIIDPQFNCQQYGRPDTDYLRFRWQPSSCNLSPFNSLSFLERMRGKTVMFVGDSLGRNQWESLICMLHSSSPPWSRAQMIAGDPLSTYNFPEYGTSLSFYRAPYLVDIDVVDGSRVLRLDDISVNGNAWTAADVLIFNSGHWWSHKSSLQGWDYMRDDGGYHEDMDRLEAFGRGLATWAKWVDKNLDSTRTRVIFQSISPTHYNAKEWRDPISKNCYGERVPVSGSNYTGVYPDQMRVVEGVLRGMRSPVFLLDITRLSELRKDAHPSVYNGDLGPDQRANPDRSADCSHWCLPGLPDTWNQLFYTYLLSFPF